MKHAPRRFPLYWDWIKSEAALLGSDGCTSVSGVHVECCWEHDISYALKKDPRAAYRLYLDGHPAAWSGAPVISRAEADARFRRCLQQRSRAGQYSPLAWWRWVGVRVWGGRAWGTETPVEGV